MGKVKTLQVGKKLIILDGREPLRYVDLTTNKVHQYKTPKIFKYIYKIKFNKEKNHDNKSNQPISKKPKH